MTFSELGLSESILRAVSAEGYSTPTPIQAQSIPFVLEGRDLLGCAQTGTGKTAAFALPILHRLTAEGKNPQNRRSPRVLVLSPTRELAAQIGDSFRVYGRNTGLRHTVIFGGVSQFRQVEELRRGIDILIATPGRLLDLMNQGFIDLRSVKTFVLDEADRMMDMGFLPDIRRIISQLPKPRQTLFFSATMPGPIAELANSLLVNPARVQIAPKKETTELIEQSIHYVERAQKPKLLVTLLQHESVSRAIVFTRTKHGADRLAKRLAQSGIHAEAIHGNKSQNARQRALTNFKTGKITVLIATDVAARGIDIDNVSHVFNFELPNDPETYVHRIGRTGRAGAAGQAIAFCDAEERSFVRGIERLTRQKLRVADRVLLPPSTEAERTESRPESRRPFSRTERTSMSPGARQGRENRRPYGESRTNSFNGPHGSDSKRPAFGKKRRPNHGPRFENARG